MAQHRSRLAATALGLAATLTVAVGLTFAATPAHAAGPTLTLSSAEVTDGQTITVKGKGLAHVPTNLFVAVCQNPPTATTCDTDLSHVVQVNYDGSGGFSTKYKVHTTFTLHSGATAHKVDCAKVECVIGTTNAANPKDHTYNATAVFTVKSAGGEAVKDEHKTETTPPQSAPTTTAGAGGTELPRTGGSPLTPMLGATGLALLLGGGALVVANSRRRPLPRD